MSKKEIEQLAKEMLMGMQEAVDELIERKAKLGQKVVVADAHGNPIVCSARSLLRKRRERNK